MATASKRKRSSCDAAFKLCVIESAENSNNYAAGRQFGVPTTYTRVNDFGQHMDSIFRGGDLYVGATYRRVYMVIYSNCLVTEATVCESLPEVFVQ